MPDSTTSAGRRWYIKRRGRVVGPYTSGQVFGLIKKKHLRPDDELRQGDDGPWRSAEQVARMAVEAKKRKAVAQAPDLPAARPVPPEPAPAAEPVDDDEPVYVLDEADEADDDPAAALAAAAGGAGRTPRYDDDRDDGQYGAYDVDMHDEEADVVAEVEDDDADFDGEPVLPAAALAAPPAAARPPATRQAKPRQEKAGRPSRGMYVAAGVLLSLALVFTVGAGVYMAGGSLGGSRATLPEGAISKNTFMVIWTDVGSMDTDDLDALDDMPSGAPGMRGGMFAGSSKLTDKQLDELHEAGVEVIVVTVDGKSLFGGTPRILIKASGGSESKLREAIANDKGDNHKVRELDGGWWIAAEKDDDLKLPSDADDELQDAVLDDLNGVSGDVRVVMNMGGFGAGSRDGDAPDTVTTGVDLSGGKMVTRARFSDADAAKDAYEEFLEERDKKLEKADDDERDAIKRVKFSRSGDTLTIRASIEDAKAIP